MGYVKLLKDSQQSVCILNCIRNIWQSVQLIFLQSGMESLKGLFPEMSQTLSLFLAKLAHVHHYAESLGYSI